MNYQNSQIVLAFEPDLFEYVRVYVYKLRSIGVVRTYVLLSLHVLHTTFMY